MNYRDFTFTSDQYLILCEKATYYRSGKGWKRTPAEIQREVVSPQHYENYVTSVPFFNNWGDGASCRAEWSYECAGYLPTRITTVSPYREKKIVTQFWFCNKAQLLESAGWREKEIVNNAVKWDDEISIADGLRLTLYTKDNGVTASGTYDFHTKSWRG